MANREETFEEVTIGLDICLEEYDYYPADEDTLEGRTCQPINSQVVRPPVSHACGEF
jgi:hypothetical protein